VSRVSPALVALVLALSGCGGDNSDEASSPKPETSTVSWVADGDTIRLTNGKRVRLVQIDAPELHLGECYGARARRDLQELLPRGRRVRLELDAKLDQVDEHGRQLAYVSREARTPMSSRSAGELRACSSTADGVGATPTGYVKRRGRHGAPAVVSGRPARQAGGESPSASSAGLPRCPAGSATSSGGTSGSPRRRYRRCASRW
jgi:Staphylococcal nuclease homologue